MTKRRTNHQFNHDEWWSFRPRPQVFQEARLPSPLLGLELRDLPADRREERLALCQLAGISRNALYRYHPSAGCFRIRNYTEWSERRHDLYHEREKQR